MPRDLTETLHHIADLSHLVGGSLSEKDEIISEEQMGDWGASPLEGEWFPTTGLTFSFDQVPQPLHTKNKDIRA